MFDQNFLFMAFLMLCFAGLATMFYFMMRNIDDLTRMLKEDRNQMQTNLRALESSLDHLGDLLSRLTATENLPRGAAPAYPEDMLAHAVTGSASMFGAADNQEDSPSAPLRMRQAMGRPLRMTAEAMPSSLEESSGLESARSAPDADGPISLSGRSDSVGLSDPAASGQGSLPNLSLDGVSPVRRR